MTTLELAVTVTAIIVPPGDWRDVRNQDMQWAVWRAVNQHLVATGNDVVGAWEVGMAAAEAFR